MELELTKKEVQQIVLKWASERFGDEFNHVEIDRYSGGYCRLTKEEETPEGTE